MVGHSIGGVVARATFLQANFVPRSVETIVTLAAPHTAPVLSVHKSISTFYDLINRYWADRSHYAPGGALERLLLVSIAGGFRDVQVRSSGADLTGVVPPEHLLFVLSTSVPDVWTQADHQSVVWCTQLTARIVRALFAAVDLRNVRPQPRLDLRLVAFRDTLSSGAPARLGFAEYGGAYDIRPSALAELPKALAEQLAAVDNTPEQLVRLTRFTSQPTFRFALEKRCECLCV